MVNNLEFLNGIFGEEWGKVHVTSFIEDPANIEKQEDRMIAWGGGSAAAKMKHFTPEQNQYFTISLFNPAEDGKARRRKALFDACFVIVVDDVKEKIPEDRAALLPEPSYKLLSSQHSEQWAYILDVPCEDANVINNLLDGLVAQGLAPSGIDPGMKGVTRYVRLPEGSNTKAKRYVNGKPFSCYLSEWNPDRLHSVDDLAKAFNIDLLAPRNENNGVGVNNADPVYSNHPIWSHVKVTGHNGDWTQIDCPNVAKHSSDDASGAAVMLHEDGSVAFQCHHGHCAGEGAAKLTGVKLIKLLEIEDEVNKYINTVKKEGAIAVAEALGNALTTATDNDLISRDDDELNLLRYVYLPNANRFYDVCTASTLSGEALDRLYLRTLSGIKGADTATKYFHTNRNAKLNIADSIGWVPFSIKKPTRKELIVDFSNKRLVNSWQGLQIAPKAGDAAQWLDHIAYLIPDEEQRTNVIKYLAFIVQHPEVKIAYTILHRGSQGVGKDLMLVPIVRALGHEASGSVTVDQLTKGWGDYMARKKFLIIEEVDKAQNRSVNNALKTVLAPTATGVRTLNLKGGEVVTQMDCLTTYMMSNKKNPLSLEKDDRRYYVIDSFIQKKEVAYYLGLDAWLKNDGVSIVIDYLLNVDLSDFSYNAPPSITSGMLEMQDAGRYDYEITIEEMANEQKAPFMLGLFTLSAVKKETRDQGVICVINSLIEAVESCGYKMLRGTKKIEGKVFTSPKYFVSEEIAATLTTRSAQYDYYYKFEKAGK